MLCNVLRIAGKKTSWPTQGQGRYCSLYCSHVVVCIVLFVYVTFSANTRILNYIEPT